MSNSADKSVVVPYYSGATTFHWAYGQGEPRIIQDKLQDAYDIRVPLALIRQLALEPELREYEMSPDDIVQCFRLYLLLVSKIGEVMRLLAEMQFSPADNLPALWLRDFVDLLKKGTLEVGWIPSDLLQPSYLTAASLLLYVVALVPSPARHTGVRR